MTNKEIAQTIIEQIKATDYLALGRYGANQYVALDETSERAGGLMFKCSGTKVQRGGKCVIELMHNDTYTVTVGRLVKADFKILGKSDDVHAEELVTHLESMIG